MSELGRAYWRYNGQWKHVYILDKFTQIDLAGNEILMVTIKLVKNTSQTFDVEFRKLESSKPRRVKEYTNL